MTRILIASFVIAFVGVAIFAQDAHPPKLERKTPPAEQQKEQKKEQKPEQKPQKNDEGDITLGTDLVSLNLTVTDQRGKRITNLKQSDIIVFDENTKQQLAFFNTTEEPFHVVLMIDISGSTQQQVDVIKQAGRNFLDQLRPGDEIAIVSFAESPTLECDFTSDRHKLERAISKLTVPPPNHAGTSFYDAIRIMVQQVLSTVEGRKAFVSITDGVDSTSKATFKEINSFTAKADATGYFIQVDTEEYTLGKVMKNPVEDGAVRFTPQQLHKYVAASSDTADPARFESSDKLSSLEKREVNGKLYEIAREELKDLAEKSGGRVYPVDKLEDTPDALKQIADEIRLQYSVGFYPKTEMRDGKYHNLRVEVKIPGATVHTRPGYTAPKQ